MTPCDTPSLVASAPAPLNPKPKTPQTGFRPKPIFTASHRLPPPVLRSFRVLRCPRPCAASLRRAARQVALFTHARGSRDAAERVEHAGRRCGLRHRGLSAWAPWRGGGHNTTGASSLGLQFLGAPPSERLDRRLLAATHLIHQRHAFRTAALWNSCALCSHEKSLRVVTQLT